MVLCSLTWVGRMVAAFQSNLVGVFQEPEGVSLKQTQWGNNEILKTTKNNPAQPQDCSKWALYRLKMKRSSWIEANGCQQILKVVVLSKYHKHSQIYSYSTSTC